VPGSAGADGWSDRRRERMREAFDDLLAVPSPSGEEAAMQTRVATLLSDLGFDVYEWDVDPDALADNPSFPDPTTLDTADRPSVGGVLELGDPDSDAGRTLVLNA